jgi:acyl carrier protein
VNRTSLLAVYARQPFLAPIFDHPPGFRRTTDTSGGYAEQSLDTPAHRQRLVSRAALRFLLALIGLPDETSSHRYRFPHRRLSLSHTEEASVAVGAIGPLPASLVGVGTDLETVRTADPRTTRFFLTGTEAAWLGRVPPQRRATEHVRRWTVKEALFKSDPANGHAVLTAFRTADPATLAGPATRMANPTARFGYVSGRIAADAWLTMAACFETTPPPSPPSPPRPERLTEMSVESTDSPEITFERVAQRVSTLLSVPLEKITPQTTLQDLAADSFRLVETVVDLQEEFDSVFTQAELKQVNTLGELVELLRSQH